MLKDIESEIFTCIAKCVRTETTGIFVAGEFQGSPATFPCLTIEEADNYVYLRTQTCDIENHAQLMYEANAYSNLKSGKKAQCKAIMRIVDEEMARLGFTRMSKSVIPNLEDASICRMVARYRAVQDKNNMIYQK